MPLRQILEEWARLGQTTIVNGDKLTGPPMTLQLVDRPEREVLDIAAAVRERLHRGAATACLANASRSTA